MKIIEGRPAWTPILACAACLAVAGNPISFAPASLFVVPVTHEFGWTRAQFFAGVSLATAVSTITLPFVGQIVDRWGPRRAILSGIIVFSGCVAGLSRLSGSWPQYLALMAVLGVSVMLHGPLPYTRVAVEAAGSRRGLGLAVAISGTTLGLILVPQIASLLISHYGWRNAEVALAAIVAAVGLPPALLFIGRARRGLEPEHGHAPPPLPWRELRSPLFWALGVAFLLNAIAVNAFLGHVGAIAVDRGLSISIGALAVSASGLGSALARLAAGFMLDKVQSPQVGQLWFGMAFAGLLVTALGAGAPSIILASALVGATLGAEVELIGYFTSRFFPPRLFGRIYGLLFPFFMAGVSLGPLAFALLFDAVHNYQIGLFAMAAAQLVGCLVLTRVGPYRYQLNGDPAAAAVAPLSGLVPPVAARD
jgi:MFS family permease